MYKLLINQKNIKNKEKYFKDPYLNEITDLCINYSQNIHILNYIRLMLYFKNNEQYDKELSKAVIALSSYYKEIILINDLFKKWQPFNKYDMGQLRGIFLELLIFKILKNNYPENIIKQETKILLEDYQSYTWDFIVELTNHLDCYECKYSPYSIKRKHIDQIVAFSNKCQKSNIFLACFTSKDKITDSLILLKENTKIDKFKENLKIINIISIEEIQKIVKK